MKINQFKSNLSNNSIIPFGKYKGSTIADIKMYDSSYYNWFIKTIFNK